MSSKVPAKSILKQPSSNSASSLTEEQTAQFERQRRNLATALYHANKIQSQKDVEARILTVISNLLDLPAGPKFTPAEGTEFTSSLSIFQPSDFDDLVEERRIAGKCGYVLCPNSPRSESLGASAVWKLKGKGAGDYCSNGCTRKALYVRTQLSQVPAWERRPGEDPAIVLHEDDRAKLNGDVAVESEGGWDVGDVTGSKSRQRRVADEAELAQERGETTASFRPKQVMMDSIVERPSKPFKKAPNDTQPTNHAAIEGYVPSQTTKNLAQPEKAVNQYTEAGLDQRDNPTMLDGMQDNDEREAWLEMEQYITKR